LQGYSRHGTCLSLLKRHEEALREFCKAYTYARNEKEMYAMAREVVSTAMEIPGEYPVGFFMPTSYFDG